MHILETKIRRIALERLSLGQRIIACLLVSMVATTAVGATVGTQPKLVVGIMVEDLRSEYLNLLRDRFGKDGFNRLLNDGVLISNADYGTSMDAAAATAVIFTGAAPAVNGIPGSEVFDRATMRPVTTLTDPEAMGNFTTQTFSPRGLAVTTLTDEIKVAGGGVTYAYAIAPEPTQALIMAGHAGNCGMWLNDANESWATTTYYKDAPTTLQQRNRNRSLHTRIDTSYWKPLLSAENYVLLPEHVTKYPFKYSFRQYSAPEKMRIFKDTPKVNEETTAFAIDNINQLNLGAHAGGPDMISVAYTLDPYDYSKTSENRYELLDSYYRLDRNLAELFNTIDKKVGLNNTLIFLAATPPSQRSRRDDEKWQLPYGEFSTRKAISLLNLYLIAQHGNGEWVHAYHDGYFYLNHKLIEDSGKDLEAIRLDCARFLERMAGVTKAYSVDEILDGNTFDTAPLRQSTVLAHAGDVKVFVLPGWQIVDDYNNLMPGKEKVERAVAATAPVMILAPNAPAGKIDQIVDARAIAPTVARLLRIRSPSAAGVPPLELEK
ncbi:MAG: alkaline phosphatase family protein [Clostridium sp.]|nr:alkaline phosphatase family protein [Clostridium sp.]